MPYVTLLISSLLLSSASLAQPVNVDALNAELEACKRLPQDQALACIKEFQAKIGGIERELKRTEPVMASLRSWTSRFSAASSKDDWIIYFEADRRKGMAYAVIGDSCFTVHSTDLTLFRACLAREEKIAAAMGQDLSKPLR